MKYHRISPLNDFKTNLLFTLQLNSIRRCGHTGSFFFLGLGRSAVTGAGDIWMLTEDAVIAENMHGIIRR